jgi:hypothetical protein
LERLSLTVTVESRSLVEEISALLEAPAAPERGPYLDRLEHTLTVGYAHALALEAERWRLERRLGELALGLADGDEAVPSDELMRLAGRMADASGDLSELRGLLVTLRDRASAVRAAA